MDTGQFFSRNGLKFFTIGLVVAVLGMFLVNACYAFSESPKFCGSCHSMEQVYATWQNSNHSQIDCTECHLPNEGMVSKLVAKAQTGITDVYHEMLRDYPVTPKVTSQGKTYLLDNCLRCHQSTVENTTMVSNGKDCITCHRDLVHARNIGKDRGGLKRE